MLKHHPVLLQQLQRLAGDTLSADAQGNCLIEIDDIEVTLKSRKNTLVVQAVLGSFLADHSVGFWRKLLALNAPLVEADRGAIGIADDEDTIVLVSNIDTMGRHDDVISEAVSTAVEQARHLINLLNREMPDPNAENDAPLPSGRDVNAHVPPPAPSILSLA